MLVPRDLASTHTLVSTHHNIAHTVRSSLSAAGAGFAAAFAKVEQALDLSPLDHAEAMGLDAWEVGGNTGTIAGFQGKKVGKSSQQQHHHNILTSGGLG